jgi:diguanylate cyclase (GGDEF)-like protein
MTLDPATVFAFSTAFLAIFAVGLLFTWHMHKDIPGLKEWLIAYAASVIAIQIWRYSGPDTPTLLALANITSGLGFLMVWQGARLYQRQPSLPAIYYAPVAAVLILGNIYAAWVIESSHMRFLVTAGVITFLTFSSSYTFLISGVRKRPANLFMGGFFALWSLLSLARLANYALSLPQSSAPNSWGALVIFVTAGVIFSCIFSIGIVLAVSQRVNEKLRQQADTDPLTMLFNRRAFELAGTQALDQCARRGANIAAVMIDIDHFKEINDTHGHAAGDQVLQALAEILQSSFRAQDVLARLGGEEFCVLMPETDGKAAVKIAERLRLKLGSTQLSALEGKRVTVSIGISGLNAATTTLAKLPTLVEHADFALYRAKQEGRDRVALYEMAPPNEANVTAAQ